MPKRNPRFVKAGKKCKDARPVCDRGCYPYPHREGSGQCKMNPVWALPEFMVERIEKNKRGCWIWTGEINRNGYGTFLVRPKKGVRKRKMSHIVVYETLVGDYDKSLFLDHKCRVRSCCNPDHLEPVTPKVNTIRGEAKLFKRVEEYEQQ